MDRHVHVLTRNMGRIRQAPTAAYSRALGRDRALQRLIADLVTARAAAGLSQEDVALRMLTTKSAVCRLESGVRTRPTLRTIQRYALAVGARLEMRVTTPAEWQLDR